LGLVWLGLSFGARRRAAWVLPSMGGGRVVGVVMPVGGLRGAWVRGGAGVAGSGAALCAAACGGRWRGGLAGMTGPGPVPAFPWLAGLT
jgi:hypothetical protein